MCQYVCMLAEWSSSGEYSDCVLDVYSIPLTCVHLLFPNGNAEPIMNISSGL